MTTDITYCTSTACPLRDRCKRADMPKLAYLASNIQYPFTKEGCSFFIQRK